jgi:peptidoglycan/xylan/chitin deacetylase (PgdA/CDA1 family)
MWDAASELTPTFAGEAKTSRWPIGSDVWAFMTAKRIPIVAYHSILQSGPGACLPEAWSSIDTVAYDSFCAQLDLLSADGWQTLPAPALNEPSVWNLGKRQILLTFDDGHDSDLLAAAALAARGFTATFYIPWVNLGRPNFLDEQGVRRLSRDGFRIGSHGMTHCRLNAVGPDRLRLELTESKLRLEDLVGLPVTDLAIPFGRYDQRVIDAALNAGYSTIMTSDVKRAVLGSRSRVYPRLPVKSCTTFPDFLTLVRGSAFAFWRWRLLRVLYGRVRRYAGVR